MFMRGVVCIRGTVKNIGSLQREVTLSKCIKTICSTKIF